MFDSDNAFVDNALIDSAFVAFRVENPTEVRVTPLGVFSETVQTYYFSDHSVNV